MDAKSLLALYKEHATAGRRLDPHEERVVSRLCEVAKSFITKKAKQLVGQASARPVLYTYGADATPSEPHQRSALCWVGTHPWCAEEARGRSFSSSGATW